jgi:hypothetical protein
MLGELGRDLGVSALGCLVGARLERGGNGFVRLNRRVGEMQSVLFAIGDERYEMRMYGLPLAVRGIRIHERCEQRVREPQTLAVHLEHTGLNRLFHAFWLRGPRPHEGKSRLREGCHCEEGRPGARRQRRNALTHRVGERLRNRQPFTGCTSTSRFERLGELQREERVSRRDAIERTPGRLRESEGDLSTDDVSELLERQGLQTETGHTILGEAAVELQRAGAAVSRRHEQPEVFCRQPIRDEAEDVSRG